MTSNRGKHNYDFVTACYFVCLALRSEPQGAGICLEGHNGTPRGGISALLQGKTSYGHLPQLPQDHAKTCAQAVGRPGAAVSSRVDEGR